MAAALALSPCVSSSEVLDLRTARVTVTHEGLSAEPEREVALPYHWDRANKGHAGQALFVVPFTLTKVPEQPWGIYFRRVGNTADIWLNGALLAKLGDTRRPNGDDFAKGPQYVGIPPGLLRQDNVFQIVIRADGGRRGGLAGLVAGPEAEVRGLYLQSFRWRISASMLVTMFSLLVGLVALALWVTQVDPTHLPAERRDSVYLAAGVAELCWALRVGDAAIEHPPLGWPWWGVIAAAAFAGWICCIALFCHHVAGWHRHRSMLWVKPGLGLLFASSVVCSSLSLVLLQEIWLTAWFAAANLLFAGYAVVYLQAAVRRGNPDTLLLAIAGILNVAMGVRDWVVIRTGGDLGAVTWIRYSSLLFGLVLGYIVISRFRQASRQSRDLMATLETRVLEKELALQRSYQQVEQLARAQERSSERVRILRDMHDGVGSHISSAIRQMQSGHGNDRELLQTLRDALDHLKLTIDTIHLPPGDVNALLASMRYRLQPRFKASGIELQWSVDRLPLVPRLESNALQQLQFMVFEALSNVLQHAQATVLRIEACAIDANLCLRIVDNGTGFDTRAPWRKGLLSLQERAAAIGATLSIDSEHGTTVVQILIRRDS